MKKKIIAMLLCAAMVGTMLTGCGEKKEEDNRELVLYTWEGLFPQEVLDQFEEEKGIKIISSNFDSNETMLEKVQQSDGKDYDLVIGDDYIIEQVVNNGLAQKLDKSKLSNYGNINPLYQSQFYDPENEYTIPHGAGIPLIVYDPEQVDFEIKGYSDLWNPELDNRELVLYTWEGLFPQEVLDQFEEEKGIKIISSNFDSNETMLEKVQQSDGKDYDLVIGDDYIIEQVVNNGLAQKLDKSKLSNYGNINPLYQSQFYDPENEYTIPHGAGIPLIVYDPEQVDFEIKGYSDLWNPELEDKIATIASYRAIEGMVLLTMGKSMNEEDPAVIKEAGEKLKELAQNIRMIQDTNTQNALLNGEAAVGILYTSQVIAALAENPDLKVVYPEEGLGFGIMNFYIPKNAPDTEEAYEFLDYILEPEVAAECFNFLGYYCTNKAADELVNPDLVVPDSVTKGEIIQNVSQEAEEVYNQNWTEFKAACD